ncbi:helix-turn-helix domain-containing protein [Ruegeria meonggei]|uniref:Ner winged helix-turn-helix DNA-binding domain-containing protein n=1 Tax=Ruegeria meonggei TaxID=1446476 RepID=A0A1X6ZMM4_9RHOB|nr:hypothetical protein RUM8411_02733 [Ruegeria meonggei]
MRHNDIPIDRARHARIKCELEIRGLKLTDLAQRIGVGASAVSSVSLGKSRSEKIEKYLASVLNQSVEELFPERYAQSEVAEEQSPGNAVNP